MRVYVIILSYNGEKYLRECLSSLVNQNYNNYEVVVVDNASIDNTKSLIRNKFPWVKLIENRKNLGFAKGCNVGIRYALRNHAEAIILLNQDTVVEEDFIKKGIELLREPKVGIVAPKVKFYGSNYIWYGGGEILRGKELLWEPTIKITKNIGKYKKDYGQFDQIRETEIAPGCALFIKREVIGSVGLLDENFFFYGEDTDFCLRCKKRGYKIIFMPFITVYHNVRLKEKLKRKISINSIRRRWAYLIGIWKVMTKHYKFYEKIIWLLKLPIAIPFSFLTLNKR